MKLVKYLTVVLLLLPALAIAGEITPYEWEKNRVRYKLTPEEQKMSELILKQHIQYEYSLEDDQFVMYNTVHRIVFVNNDEAVQKHNRITIFMGSAIELMDVKARAINKDGKVVNFDKSNLKELKDEESGNAYKIFAIEGIELGSEVEYYFTKKMRASLFDRSFLQFDVVVKKATFKLSCPNHLKFDFKPYQGFAEIKTEEGEERNVYTAEMENVPALKEEPYSFFDNNRRRVEFKLAYNVARSKARLYTWDEAAKSFYQVLYDVSKDDEKALDKFAKSLGDNSSDELWKRIKNVENKIKTSVNVNNERGDKELGEISSIIKYKTASKEGITKLFVAVYGKLGINCHPLITCNREDIRFDGKFDSWTYLDEYMLYFPDTKGFMAPYVFEIRYPMPPSEWAAQDALFIEPFAVGELKSALATVAEVPAATYDVNKDNLEIDVKFNQDLSGVAVHQKRIFSGYNALFVTPYYDLMTDDQRKEMSEELVKQTAPDAQIKKWVAKPLNDTQISNFLLDTEFESAHFVERAGPRILFKAGELIGPQSELYRDDKRLTPVENDYNRGYERIIRIQIPSGYAFKNLNDLKFNVRYEDGDKTPFLFVSDYKVTGDILEIKIDEFYKQIYAPVARYEDFRKVINAAADFNKVTLVLEKIK